MTNKITLNLNVKQVEKLVEKSSLEEKLKLVRKLEKETLRRRWGEILKDIDKRLKRFPISKKEIEQEIKAYRRQEYAKGHH